jgi:hypothetical protein
MIMIIFLMGILQLLSVVNENVSLVISRQMLTDVSTQLTVLSDPISKAVSHYTLDKVNIYVIKNRTCVILCINFEHCSHVFKLCVVNDQLYISFKCDEIALFTIFPYMFSPVRPSSDETSMLLNFL